MKGIILAGGSGSRLSPLTKVTSKQLLPVYDQPMVYYPLQTLLKAGIRDILFIVAPDHSGDFVNLLGSGRQFGARFAYEVQDSPEGLAQALMIGEDFIEGEQCALILGDNIYTDDFSEVIQNFKAGCTIFCKEVSDPERFGVVSFDESGRVESIVEKPVNPRSNYAQTGLYLYDERAVGFAKQLKKSERGEYEIVDLHNMYLSHGELTAHTISGEWIDAGTFESLHKASCIVREHRQKESSKLSIEVHEIKKPEAA